MTAKVKKVLYQGYVFFQGLSNESKNAQKTTKNAKKLKFSFHYYISIIKTTSGKMEVLGLEPWTLRTGARVANHYTTVTSRKRELRNGY